MKGGGQAETLPFARGKNSNAIMLLQKGSLLTLYVLLSSLKHRYQTYVGILSMPKLASYSLCAFEFHLKQ